MADLISKQIRDLMMSRMDGVAAFTGKVFGRTHPLDESKLPAARIWFDEESRERQPVSGVVPADPISKRTAQFSMEVIVKTSGDVDDALDGYRKTIEPALLSDRELGGLTRDIRIAGISRQADLGGDRKVAQDTYSIEADYLCRDSAPDTAIQVS